MTVSKPSPTDMMQRRIPLSAQKHFFLFQTAITIKSNSEAILNSAERTGFVPVTGTYRKSFPTWQIVGSPIDLPFTYWQPRATLGCRSLYLAMGIEQWFAFDLETHEGAGFVLLHNAESDNIANLARYLASIVWNVEAALKP